MTITTKAHEFASKASFLILKAAEAAPSKFSVILDERSHKKLQERIRAGTPASNLALTLRLEKLYFELEALEPVKDLSSKFQSASKALTTAHGALDHTKSTRPEIYEHVTSNLSLIQALTENHVASDPLDILTILHENLHAIETAIGLHDAASEGKSTGYFKRGNDYQYYEYTGKRSCAKIGLSAKFWQTCGLEIIESDESEFISFLTLCVGEDEGNENKVRKRFSRAFKLLTAEQYMEKVKTQIEASNSRTN